MTNSSLAFKILAIVFATIAIISFSMPSADIIIFSVSGYKILKECIENIHDITRWELTTVCFLFSAVFAVFSFLFGLLSLSRRGIGSIIFGALGISSMLFFSNEVGFNYIGAGVYVYIIALFLSCIFSIAGLTNRSKE